MPNSNRRNIALIVAVLVVIALLLLLVRCNRSNTVAVAPTTTPAASDRAEPGPPTTFTSDAPELLTSAALQAPTEVGAGSPFSVTWTGPNNPGDFIALVRRESPDRASGAYALTSGGSPLQMTAPVEPANDWELRYVTGRSRKVLGRLALAITPAAATVTAADSVTLDTPLSISWTGPTNPGDYITIVERNAPDGRHGPYTETSRGSPLTVTAPAAAGDAEIRYMTGQGRKVLARRPLKIVVPDVTLSAPAEAVAGANVSVNWTGPANSGDFITVVPKAKPDGQHGNYTLVNKTSPLTLKLLMEPGDAEIRYMTGRGGVVLARRPILIRAAEVSLSAPATATAGSPISVTWSGPANDGDFITIVARGTPEQRIGNYILTNKGSPITIPALKEATEAELRYVSGQGRMVLARRPITITP